VASVLQDLAAKALPPDGDGRLPTIHELTRLTHASAATVSRAVKVLAERGVVRARQRAGIRVLGRADASGELLSPATAGSGHAERPKWRRLHARIKTDIVTGQFRPASELPPSKELCTRYGADQRTLRKALEKLADERVIAADRRAYRIAAFLPPGGRNAIVLIAPGDRFGEVSFAWEPVAERYRLLETECARAGVRLVVRTGYWHNDDMLGIDEVDALVRDAAAQSSVIGYLVWATGLQAGFLSEVLALTQTAGKPVAVLDEEGGAAVAQTVSRNPRARLFQLYVDAESGRLMARHLLGLGHRAIAFIHPDPIPLWAGNRLSGMREEAASVGSRVVAFPARRVTQVNQSVGLDPPDFMAVVKLFRSRFPEAQRVAYPLPERSATDVVSHISDAILRHVSRATTYPLLEQVLARSDLTAWVGAHDPIAVDCMDFLRMKDVAVPGRISVAGFDDRNEASFQRLTSCNFNNAACIQALLGYLLHPGLRADSRSNREPVRISGFVMPRRTTGRAAGV